MLPLVAVTYLMVCGGPYGLEELIHNTGFLMALIVLLVTPLLWSLPTTLMLGELASALPEEGGYYTWVRRALGPFWGFQEAWLSLTASIFDMAIYPTLFVLYLGRLCPGLGSRLAGWGIGIAVVSVCALVNILGVRVVGRLSVLLSAALIAPFVLLAVQAGGQYPPQPGEGPQHGTADFLAGVLVAMWNYMGWDNASTIAGEVDRPQRTYPRAILATVLLVALTYLLPVLAVSGVGLALEDWSTGAWVEVGEAVGGRALAVLIAVGGMICGMGMCNALVLSYSRLPVVLAEDRYLPAVFRRRHPRTGAPWVSVLACAAGWALALGLGFQRLVALDVTLYGLSLLLEFVALVWLRRREPTLPRPFRVPGGTLVAGLLGVGPALLLGLALWHERGEQAGPINALLLAMVLVALGPVLYLANRWLRRREVAC
jgi:amino acid transporter